ncbi:MAG: hypothetical protein COZ49_03520 [Candidatus Yonathbacteria bacterium CG_4_10_14_3_um_filter_47_65]|uniref:Uncharacterized protein n=2 Tax=Parcubacteria group TaxID=1794811 RepID=A0A2M8D772_9BACT|nr:MAG: hypothetical protein AUJ44_01370 [Candidatus Nomurabacteria bacterium CG1_02_47_685]PIP03473.1 MAG: hypothetical protein COX54_03465 [Candidatus Yonathbacteria bacterium CG23_combo_of_CG06-09_8_20_14_all_46_18]PIQ32962.1 MAG: hypothetical protein COW61_00625 [Candidatus Yonathbacteria bacterium CG17_big_fil_post_rev_8_21_14_2_50_46_19]PIX56183.1 MAG: hypothetical protein COZ49_03520 [Candidatus Yonathbacteria bacterium CG_4_10_14_3_um_filter_47_65]PIY57653.1 MAG: hypothetical protein CO
MNQEEPNFSQVQAPLAQKQIESLKTEKEIAWDKKLVEIDELADRLGLGVDEKIKEPVAAFLINEFTTSSSCEGHVEEEGRHGALFPWVEIYASEPEGWKEATGEKKEEIEQAWTVRNLEQQQKMMSILAEFYQGRETPFDARLVFDPIGAFGGFRVQSFGAEMMKLLPVTEQHKKRELYRREINDFAFF